MAGIMAANQITVITSIYGDYDALKPLPRNHGFDDAICVTDNPKLRAAGWRIVVFQTMSAPVLSAKRAKCMPWLYAQTPMSVWLDGSMRIRSNRFHDEIVRRLRYDDIVVRKHPSNRNDPYEEAVFCANVEKYRNMPMDQQVESYRQQGMPLNVGLWECGIIGRIHTAHQIAFGERWHAEQHRWTTQDQLSFPYLCWLFGIKPGEWDFTLWNNEYVEYQPHRDGT